MTEQKNPSLPKKGHLFFSIIKFESAKRQFSHIPTTHYYDLLSLLSIIKALPPIQLYELRPLNLTCSSRSKGSLASHQVCWSMIASTCQTPLQIYVLLLFPNIPPGMPLYVLWSLLGWLRGTERRSQTCLSAAADQQKTTRYILKNWNNPGISTIDLAAKK